jgi:hypothetical protein
MVKMQFPQTGFDQFHLLNFIFNLTKFQKLTVSILLQQKISYAFVQYFTVIVITVESFKHEINNFDIDIYQNKKTLV